MEHQLTILLNLIIAFMIGAGIMGCIALVAGGIMFFRFWRDK